MIIVKEIKWTDREAMEADVVLSDGSYKLMCFAYPCNLSEKDSFGKIILGFGIVHIYKVDQEVFEIEKSEGFYNYRLVGKLLDNEILQIGEFKIDLSGENIPRDIQLGSFIEINVSRLDI
ncbi:hypothetical protein [Listeria ilorinensis]|uniref:hypothetical protein n=1 Tax=Listeria ilorinensis TaxID=2867439 RepID=UPI001EF5B216|nr:hypothetical protein [Listeria ilorinensis]